MDYLDNIDQGIKAWEDAIKKEQELKSDLDNIAGHVGEALLRNQNNTRDFNHEIHFGRIVSLLGN